ncbi:MAG: bifunctional aspartate kinase/homoserine dehydrogenase I [Bacteroidales bacterium]|nr:bifunctional aspartate kinase/homoserine dehydrogenase I [Bacteroidales bacterium]
MQVLKFGGSSVANVVNILKVVSIVADAVKKDRTILVASAIGGCTDKLIKAASLASDRDLDYKEIISSLEDIHNTIILGLIPEDYREQTRAKCGDMFKSLNGLLEGISLTGELTQGSCDLAVSYGELLSTTIISAKLSSLGINNIWTDSRELVKTISHNYQNIVDIEATDRNITNFLNANGTKLWVVPGYIASDHKGRTTTLGRGGSDFTASLFSAASGARVLEIWTDVNGMMTADPRVVPDAKTIENISYKEALELSHFGAKVVYPPTIQPAVAGGIPIIVKNTFDPHGASTIIENRPPDSRGKIRGISGSGKIALLSLEGSGMVGIPGYSARLFTALANAKVNIVLITQASSLHTMCVAIEESVANIAGNAVDETFAYERSLGKVESVKVERGYSIISLVGDDMKNQSGTSGKMFDALGRAGINIRAIAQGSSEKNISAIVDAKDSDNAVRVVHEEFFGFKRERVNLFIAGFGNVGKSLVNLINETRENIAMEWGKDIVIAGICNSTRSVTDREGIDPSLAGDLLASGERTDITGFIKEISALSLGNSIFADCTAQSSVAVQYADILDEGVSVVTCNKIALSSSIEYWDKLKRTALDRRVSLLYETSAGAALPVIETLSRLKVSGEKIISVEAILSGTLNYLYSNYDGTKSFASLVKEAKDAGYTEPDPRVDLSGTDVLRKCTIIARECGFRVEQRDVLLEPLADKSLFNGSLPEFYAKIEEAEPLFFERYKSAADRGERLRYVATIEEGCYKVGLRSLPLNHPLYNISGTNNSVMITTSNYPAGVVISGAGAGARVTAGGVLNDILKVGI